MKENLKPCAYKHIEPSKGDMVLFVERSGERLYVASLSLKDWRRSESESKQGV